MDDLDDMPLAKRRRLLLSARPFSSRRAPSPTKRLTDVPGERVSLEVSKEWPGLPRGVRFNPSDADLLWHLLAKVGKGRVGPHPFIHEFITCLDEFDGFGYTHPQKLPGMNKNGIVSYFFHKSFKTHDAESGPHRDDDSGYVCWQKSGKSKPLFVDGKHQGYKTIMTLYISMKEAENPNWVMHQYHLGERKAEGEFVVSKIFYKRTRQVTENEKDIALEAVEAIPGEVESAIISKSITPKPHGVDQHLDQVTAEAISQDILMDGHDPKDLQSSKVYNDSQVDTVNSDLVPNSEIEGHTAEIGGNGLLQPSNHSNQFMEVKIEQSDCSACPFEDGLDRITGVHYEDYLDNVLLHERSYMLLSNKSSGSIGSRCYIDSSKYGLNQITDNSLHAEDSGFALQNDSMSNLEIVYGKDIFGLVQDISAGPVVHDTNESEPSKVQDEMHSPNLEDNWREYYLPESGTPHTANKVMAEPPQSTTTGSPPGLILLKTEPVEEGCASEITEKNIGAKADQMISNCSKEAHATDPKLSTIGQTLTDQNDRNNVVSVLPTVDTRVKVEALEDIGTYNGLEATTKKHISSSVEARTKQHVSSSLGGSSAETRKHTQFPQRNNHHKDKFSSGCCDSQRKISTTSICSVQLSLNKDSHLNLCSSKSLNSISGLLENPPTSSPCLQKTSNRPENVSSHERSSAEEVGKNCSQPPSFSVDVQFNNIESHMSRIEVKKESVDDLSKDMRYNMIYPKPDMLASEDVSNSKHNNNVNNSQQFLLENQNCEQVDTIGAQVSHTSLRRKRKKTATDSVEKALEEDAPGLLQVLLKKGITVDEIKLYGATEDVEALEISLEDDDFKDLETVITKIFSVQASLFKLSVARHVKGSKAVYCLACLISLIEQTRYLQFRDSPVEWGWCRDLQSFIFVFQRHNRIVLERPEYGYATYFFELVDSLPIDWQIKRLVMAMKLTSCSRTTLIENKPLLVGEDLTEGEARVLEEYGWTPNCGLGTMLNYCDRVVHDKKYERYSSEWRAKIGRLLMVGHDAGRTVLFRLPKKVGKNTENGNLEIKMEN